MSMLDAPMLPSPNLRAHYAMGVSERIAKVKGSLHTSLLDGLGDLACSLARLPMRHWCGEKNDLARLMTHRWTWPEATALVEIAEKVGLLVPWLDTGMLKPREYGQFLWLGARRIALTEDQDELMDHRMNGALFDMFALAPGFVSSDMAQGLVRVMAERPAPWDEILDLSASLAAAAVAWGAAVDDELRQHLVERAHAWTQPMGMEWNREIGTAFLVNEASAGPWRDEITNTAIENFNELIQSALGDPELAEVPVVIATLETQLAVMLAGYGATAQTIDQIMGRLPTTHAHLVGNAVARVTAPGVARNELLVEATRAALTAGDTAALTTLTALVEPLAGAIGPIHDVFQQLLENLPGDPPTQRRVFGACQAIASWESCPELTLHLLSRIVVSTAEPELRIAAAAALSRHTKFLGHTRQVLLDTLEGELTAPDRLTVVGATGAAMHLGSQHPKLMAMAVALVADGAPFDLLGPAFDDALRQVPAHGAAFEEMIADYAGNQDIIGAALGLCVQVADALHREHDLGPFFIPPPLTYEVRGALTRFLMPLAANLEVPHFAADAATTCAWLMRGDRGYSLTCLNLRAYAQEPKQRAMYDLALGACGVADPEVIERLGKDAAQGPPDLSAAAAVALRVMLETYDQGDLLEAWLPTIRARCDLAGAQQGPLIALLQQLATMPLGTS